MKKLLIAASIAALTSTANAALHQRGAQMAYDDVLDITWLLDANYSYTSGYTVANQNYSDYSPQYSTTIWASGGMGWGAAKNWASQLTIVDPTYGTVSGWRLASARLQTPVNYTDSYPTLYDGTTDEGYNVTSSELGHMFFNNLGNKARFDINGNVQSGYGVTNSTYTDANGSITIQNLKSGVYWYDEGYSSYNAWFFTTSTGVQGVYDRNWRTYAWAVRDGDVCTTSPCPVTPVNEVPVPAAAWLFGSALVGLVGLRRKK